MGRDAAAPRTPPSSTSRGARSAGARRADRRSSAPSSAARARPGVDGRAAARVAVRRARSRADGERRRRRDPGTPDRVEVQRRGGAVERVARPRLQDEPRHARASRSRLDPDARPAAHAFQIPLYLLGAARRRSPALDADATLEGGYLVPAGRGGRAGACGAPTVRASSRRRRGERDSRTLGRGGARGPLRRRPGASATSSAPYRSVCRYQPPPLEDEARRCLSGPDADEQRAAVERAGVGGRARRRRLGKTTRPRRALRRTCCGPARTARALVEEVAQILAITFTEKAAAEMKRRIRTLVAAALAAPSGAERDALGARAARAPRRADLDHPRLLRARSCARTRSRPASIRDAVVLDEHESRAYARGGRRGGAAGAARAPATGRAPAAWPAPDGAARGRDGRAPSGCVCRLLDTLARDRTRTRPWLVDGDEAEAPPGARARRRAPRPTAA